MGLTEFQHSFLLPFRLLHDWLGYGRCFWCLQWCLAVSASPERAGEARAKEPPGGGWNGSDGGGMGWGWAAALRSLSREMYRGGRTAVRQSCLMTLQRRRSAPGGMVASIKTQLSVFRWQCGRGCPPPPPPPAVWSRPGALSLCSEGCLNLTLFFF